MAPSLLDLDHLSQQTLGNRDLQRQILELFLGHSRQQVELLKESTGRREQREAAHAIVGSARAIGAFDVARIAGEIERGEGSAEAEFVALAKAVEETRDFIVALLAK